MFTGIVSACCRVGAIETAEGGARLLIEIKGDSGYFDSIAIGESIAVCGVCLTVESNQDQGSLRFFLTDETLDRTRLGELKPGHLVNLERSLRGDDRIGGHLVMGHVDGTGRIARLEPSGESWLLEVEYPSDLAPFLAVKGSIAVDGISLTVTTLTETTFGAALIPHTVEFTNLKEATIGMAVNLEADMLARYVVRALEALESRQRLKEQDKKKPGQGLTEEFLIRAGFIDRQSDEPTPGSTKD